MSDHDPPGDPPTPKPAGQGLFPPNKPPTLTTTSAVFPEPRPPRRGSDELRGEISRGCNTALLHGSFRGSAYRISFQLFPARHVGDSEDWTSFVREAMSLAHLSRPRLVPMIEVGNPEGRPYFTLTFIDGNQPREWLDMEARPSEVAPMLARLVKAVKHAYEHPILNAKLCPAKILVDSAMIPPIDEFVRGHRPFVEELANELAKAMARVEVVADPAHGDAVLPEALDIHVLTEIIARELAERMLASGKDPVTIVPLRRRARSPERRWVGAAELAEEVERWLGDETTG